MIITVDEYRSMGFYCGEDEEQLLNCLKRAEFVVVGMTDGKALEAVSAGGTAAQYVKQATAFQAAAMLKKEQATSGGTERVALGDFSYTLSEDYDGDGYVHDTEFAVVSLLRAAGCMYTGRRVR